MTLLEMSAGYAHAASLLRSRLRLLRRQLETAKDPEELFQLRRRIKELTPMLTEMNELAHLTAHYYDRGYYRDEKYTMQRISGPAIAQRKSTAAHPHSDGQ